MVLSPQPSSRCATPGLSVATLASLGGTSSRRGSADAGSVYDPDTSLSELKVRRLKRLRPVPAMNASSRVWSFLMLRKPETFWFKLLRTKLLGSVAAAALPAVLCVRSNLSSLSGCDVCPINLSLRCPHGCFICPLPPLLCPVHPNPSSVSSTGYL